MTFQSFNNKSVYIYNIYLNQLFVWKAFTISLHYLHGRKITESITLLCNSIQKAKKRKIQTSQTYVFFYSLYIKSTQNGFVLHNKGAKVLFK